MNKSITREIPLSSIVQCTNFSRSVYDKSAMESLKKSITDFGLLQPVGVSPNKGDPNKFDLVYGYRRFVGFVELGKQTIPALVVSENPLSEDMRMKMNVAENAERKDVTLLESGLRWRKLIESGRYTVKELSYSEGVAEKRIDEVLAMYKTIPQKYIDLIVSNDVRRDQSNMITQSKAHAVMTAAKFQGLGPYIDSLFELIRRENANEKEILEVRKLIQAGYQPKDALLYCRKLTTKYMSKALTFKVKKRKWQEFQDVYGRGVSEVIAKAIKKGDTKVLTDMAAFLA